MMAIIYWTVRYTDRKCLLCVRWWHFRFRFGTDSDYTVNFVLVWWRHNAVVITHAALLPIVSIRRRTDGRECIVRFCGAEGPSSVSLIIGPTSPELGWPFSFARGTQATGISGPVHFCFHVAFISLTSPVQFFLWLKVKTCSNNNLCEYIVLHSKSKFTGHFKYT